MGWEGGPCSWAQGWESPPTMPLSSGIVGTHESLLTVEAPCYKSSLVPRALWAAEHRAGAGGVCGGGSDTERVPPKRKGPGSSLSPVRAETEVSHVDGSRRPPGVRGERGRSGDPAPSARPPGVCLRGEGVGRRGVGKENSWRRTRQRMPWPLTAVRLPITAHYSSEYLRELKKKKCPL